MPRPRVHNSAATAAQARRARARLRSQVEIAAAQEIGDIPPVRNSERKTRARYDFRFFCEAYFPRKFSLAWSEDHLRVIAKIENAVLHGGLFAMAMPRGSGKTTLCEIAAVWALVYGHHLFIMLIGSCDEYAGTTLANVKIELARNDLLHEDFPEVTLAIRKLEGESRRCTGQMHHGAKTFIYWGADRITLPTIPGSRASGATVRVAGLTANLRGAVHTLPTGESVRPSLVIIDDPQTDQSARSPSQCAQRESILTGAILGLAGPGKKISAVMPCTVIRKGDLSDRILDRKQHPEWQGERTKMVYAFPAAEKRWDEYARLRRESLEHDGNGREATDYYAEHREEMDRGAVIAWPARHNPDELSAIQHAMNLRIDRKDPVFFAEYQNEPLDDSAGTVLDEATICAHANGVKRGVVPAGMGRLTMFVDVQKELLFYAVVAWADDFTGHLVEYGSYPDQKRAYFTLHDAKLTMSMVKRGAAFEGTLLAGLNRLAELTLGREWRTEDGTVARIDRCLVDANWGQSTATVREFCRRSPFAALLMPAHGRYVGASSVPITDKHKIKGERIGHYWRVSVINTQRHALYDTNYWKSFLYSRLSLAPGDRTGLTLHGRPGDHAMLADHLTAEHAVRTEGRGRTVDEWKLTPGRDNHWLDCLVGCSVAASIVGCATDGMTRRRHGQRERIRLSDLQRAG